MMIYQDGSRMSFAVADLYGQQFAVGKDFKPENYHPELHYGINYLMAVGDDFTEVHFNCEQLNGITEMQLLSVLVDRITRRAVDSESPPFENLRRLRNIESNLRQAFSALGEIDV